MAFHIRITLQVLALIVALSAPIAATITGDNETMSSFDFHYIGNHLLFKTFSIDFTICSKF